MRNATTRGIIAFLLMAGAVALLYGPWGFGGPIWAAGGLDSPFTRSAGTSEFTYVADIDFWQRSPRERQVTSPYAFDLAHDLAEVPLVAGQWQGQDWIDTNPGVFMVLEPEQYVARLYRDGNGHRLWLHMVGGRSSRTFHAPESCYESYGWQTGIRSHAVSLDGGGAIYGMLVEAQKEGRRELSYYVYLFPRPARALDDGLVVFRVTTPLYQDTATTLGLQEDFMRHFFTHAEEPGR